jgi:signal transduction histidine kinase
MDTGTHPRSAATGVGASDPADLNLRILQSLALWLKETAGDDALRKVAAAGEVSAVDLTGRSVWVSWERFERILAAAAEYTTGEEQFRAACAHRVLETYGPLLLLLKAASPQLVFQQAGRGFPMISAISSTELRAVSRTRTICVYRSTKPESRHLCLTRQGQAVFLPTLWGLPKATIVERSCIGWGDDTCEYELRCHASRRWLPVAGAGLAGASVWLGAALAGLPTAHWVGVVALTLLALSMYALELWKANAANIVFAEDARAALGTLAAEEAEVRRELVALEGRQADWLRRVERELEGRNQELEELEELEGLEARVDGLHEKRVRVLRGQVHDLRNLLMGVRYALEVIDEDPLSDAAREAVRDATAAINRGERALRHVIQQSQPGRVLVALERERLDVERLGEALRRRLRALTRAKGLRVAVAAGREAPAFIVTDSLLLDRVLDNLLGNAAKYTTRGSIAVDVGGTPGFLTVKIADTGPGISTERLARVFRPGGSALDERIDGFGVGLSVVVQLLAQIGGRLEVMSSPGEGTTFWVYVPVECPAAGQGSGIAAELDESDEQLFHRVVQVRAVN